MCAKKGPPKKIYDPDVHLPLVIKAASEGKVIKEIARDIGISRTLFFEWRNEFPELADAIKSSKPVVVGKVIRSLIQRAIGYEATETKSIVSVDPNTGEAKPVRRETTTKHIPGDVGAICFALKNLDRENWKDAHTLTHEKAVDLDAMRKIILDEESSELETELLRRIIDSEEIAGGVCMDGVGSQMEGPSAHPFTE